MSGAPGPFRIAAVAALAAALVIPAAGSAQAADLMEVTWPGGSTSNPNSTPLLDELWAMLPNDSTSTRFVVTNLSSTDAFLRVTLVDVQSTDAAFASALTIVSSTATSVGATVAIGTAQPCHVLLEGDIVEAGDSLAVLVDIALGDLQGTAGQAATVGFAFRVALSDALPGDLPPSDCGIGGAVVPGTGPAPAGRDARESRPTPFVVDTETLPTGPNAPVAVPAGGLAFASNTSRFFEEYTVLFLVVPWLTGIVVYMLLAGRRRRIHLGHRQ